jgi:hypothetical protein
MKFVKHEIPDSLGMRERQRFRAGCPGPESYIEPDPGIIAEDGFFFDQLGALHSHWVAKEDVRLLLQDVITFANKIIRGNDDSQVVEFAGKWGPVWYCQRHGAQCWGRGHESWHGISDRCVWNPEEPVNAYRREILQIRAAVQVGLKLAKGQCADQSEWDRLYPSFTFTDNPAAKLANWPLLQQRQILAAIISGHLTHPGGPSFTLHWDSDSDSATSQSPALVFGFGHGFVPAAWLAVAQTLSRRENIFVCSGCGLPYSRSRKRPAPGKANYCDPCGKKAAKKAWARTNRGNPKKTHSSGVERKGDIE